MQNYGNNGRIYGRGDEYGDGRYERTIETAAS